MLKISAIIPVYNTEKYLKKCLDSVINQTYNNLEIIVVNDGSTDNSEKIIFEYMNKFPNKIKYFSKKNTGIADTRNYGVAKVSEEYFLFVDSDDFIELDLCSNLAEYINNSKIDIIKYKMKTIILESDKINKIDGPIFNISNGPDAFNLLCFKDIMIDTPCLYLFNTNFFKKNKFKFSPNKSHEDFGLIPLIIVKSNSFLSTDIYGYNYIYRQNSITKNEDYNMLLKQSYDLLYHYDNIIKEIKKINLDKITINNLKQYYTNSILLIAKKLIKKDRKNYILEIKHRKLNKNIKVKNIKQLLKRIILNLNINLYLKMR